MSGIVEILLVVVAVIISQVLKSGKKNGANASKKDTGTGRNGGYDPSAPPGSRRNPLGRPGTGAAGTAAQRTDRRAGASATSQNRQDGFQSILKNRRHSVSADDGHRLFGDEDVSCSRFGHVHPEADDMPRYIVHDDPEDGYILLNGKKMLLSEADRYENTI